jgi:topoisomerase-4 subunit A
VLASGAGYGFVVKLGDLHSRNRAGKAVLKVPEGSDVIAPVPMAAAEDALLAAVNTDGRLLTFPAADLPELPRGKGNKIFGISSKKAAAGEESLVAIAVVAPGQSLRVLSGERHMGLSFRELGEYRGERGQRGAVLPRGWRKVDGLEVEGG